MSFCLSVCLSVCYQTWEHDVLKTNELISFQIGTSGQWGRGMKRWHKWSVGPGHEAVAQVVSGAGA